MRNGLPPPHLRWAALVLVAAGAWFASGSAEAAPPPPPRFQELLLVNGTTMEVVNIVVDLHTTQGTAYTSFTNDMNRLTVSTLPPGASIVLSLGSMFGVSRIVATAECPAPRRATVTLEAPRVGADPSDPYTAYCTQSPDGQSNYQPRLRFFLQDGAPRAELSGRGRWGLVWKPLQTSTSPFQ